MARELTNRSLERGLSILEALAQRRACSLSDLNRSTGLAKSTLRRLLAPLLAHHIVRRSLGDQLYRINIALPLIRGARTTPRTARIIEIASPHMIELTQRVKWPSDLHLRSGNRMCVVESTRALSPFHIGRARVDLDVSLFGAASGRAYLSALRNDEVGALIRSAGDHPAWGLGRLHTAAAEFIAELNAIRSAGYATRSPKYDGESKPPDRLYAMAVPIFQARAPTGALTLVWPRRHLRPEQFAKLYLADLAATAQRISSDLAKFDKQRTKTAPRPGA